MRLKKYLDLSPDRPLWAKVVDAILATNTPKSENLPINARQNIFLQSWTTLVGKSCPRYIRKMLTTARKYGVRVEALRPSEEIIGRRPIWHHLDATTKVRRKANSKAGKCLRDKHKVETVEDAMTQIRKGSNEEHRETRMCGCRECVSTRDETGCDNPDRCFKAANRLTSCIHRRWRPNHGEIQDQAMIVDLNEPMNANNRMVIEREIPRTEKLEDTLRIFTKGRKH